MKPVDCHCHLDFEQFDEDRQEVIEKARDDLEFVVNAGSSVDNNRATLKLAENHPDFILPALGLHPCYTDRFSELEDVKKLIRDKDPVAIGEIGLDHHHVNDQELQERQEEVFRELLELAEQLEKPVVVHSRDAEQRAFNILREFDLQGVMLHCFNGKPELAEKAVEERMSIGVTTQVLYSERVRNIVKTIGLENMLLETDSPYLYKGERNQPSNVRESCAEIAELKSTSREKVVQSTTSNARNFFT